MSDRSRSGSSTPTTSTINDSTFTATGTCNRGGRRKNITSNVSVNSTARGQKRKKDQRTTQSQSQQSIIINQKRQGMQTDNISMLNIHGSGGIVDLIFSFFFSFLIFF